MREKSWDSGAEIKWDGLRVRSAQCHSCDLLRLLWAGSFFLPSHLFLCTAFSNLPGPLWYRVTGPCSFFCSYYLLTPGGVGSYIIVALWNRAIWNMMKGLQHTQKRRVACMCQMGTLRFPRRLLVQFTARLMSRAEHSPQHTDLINASPLHIT